MSDWIMHNGRKYFEEGYLQLANRNSERRGETIKKLTAELASVRKTWIEEIAIRDEMIRQATS